MNLYYKINEDIINNYDNKNKNYENIDYLNRLLKKKKVRKKKMLKNQKI